MSTRKISTKKMLKKKKKYRTEVPEWKNTINCMEKSSEVFNSRLDDWMKKKKKGSVKR